MDEINNSIAASTTVPIHSNITTWLNSLDIPVHKGYALDHFETRGVNIYNVTHSATVYIRYSVEGKNVITSYVNDDGDIALDCKNSGWTYTGRADIAITFSKNFDTVEFDHYDIYDLSATGKENRLKHSTIGDNIISFTDDKSNTHDLYIIALNSKGNHAGQAAWDSGFKPILVSVALRDYTGLYKVVTNN